MTEMDGMFCVVIKERWSVMVLLTVRQELVAQNI